MLAVSSTDAGSWLQALPLSSIGLLLSDREIRVATGLRLGIPVVSPHMCAGCGVQVDSTGHHGLSCKKSAGRQKRHAQVNEVLVRALRAAEVEAELEPRHLLPHCDKRPDGVTTDNWSRGKPMAWDFTCPNTLAPSYLSFTSSVAGAAASKAEANKRTKYASLLAANTHEFCPVAIETLGAWGQSASDLCRSLGARLARISGDPRSLQFLKQRLSMAVQRGNAVSVVGTFRQGKSQGDDFWS